MNGRQDSSGLVSLSWGAWLRKEKQRGAGRATLRLSALVPVLAIALLCTGCYHGDEAADAESLKRITLTLDGEPPSLNTLISEDNNSYQIIDHISEGLLVFGPDHKLVAGVAQSWEFDPASGVTFRLRPDAQWSDGSAVTAHDFVFAWQQVVSPATGSGYAYILYPVQNAEAINRGELPVDRLGVTAVDDHTLKVTFERPCSYFLSLAAFSVYRPVQESFYRSRGGRYAADAGDLLYNGPFRISRWVHGAKLVLEKNPFYWARNTVAVDQIDYAYFTGDASTALNLFLDGKIMLANLDSHSTKIALMNHLNIKADKPGTVYYLSFNLKEERVTRSPSLRHLIQSVVDTEELALRVLGVPGAEPGVSIFPAAMRARFSGPQAIARPSLANGLGIDDLLEQTKRELGSDSIPPIVLLVRDNSINVKTAEYLQQVFANKLNIELKIDRQTFKQLLAKSSTADYDIYIASWAPDFDDPLAYATAMTNRYADGSRHFVNTKFDEVLDRATVSDDTAVRNAAFRAMHEIVAREVPVVPLFVQGKTDGGLLYVQDARLRRVRRSSIAGSPNFNFARLE
jgi:oligopeptide transport system substrate-binding protein